jgi:hypothetical protein
MIDSAGMEGFYGLEEVPVLAEGEPQLIHIHGGLPVLGPVIETVLLADFVGANPASGDLHDHDGPPGFKLDRLEL